VDPNESEQCYGQQAAAQLKQLAPPGSTVWVQRDEELTDRYGRYLLYLWNSEGTFVNLSLVKDGYARAVLYQPNDNHWDTISAAENDAQTTQVGLWGVCSSFGAPVATPEPTGPAPGPGDTGGAYLFPPPPPDKDCGSIAAGDFPVRRGDPHRLDRDRDGVGGESCPSETPPASGYLTVLAGGPAGRGGVPADAQHSSALSFAGYYERALPKTSRGCSHNLTSYPQGVESQKGRSSQEVPSRF